MSTHVLNMSSHGACIGDLGPILCRSIPPSHCGKKCQKTNKQTKFAFASK